MCVIGIGRELCKSLRSAGAVVYALDKAQQHLDSLVAEVQPWHRRRHPEGGA